jgi:homoserine dehydrogenase
VDDEFNAVVVQAAYADKQLFYGKGAGSFPTASAVLSDISALQFNYRYEYRKSTNELLDLSHEIQLYVYLSSYEKEALKQIEFEEIDDLYISKGYCYKIGKIRLSEIRRIQWNDQKELTLLIFSDSSKRKVKNSSENNYSNFQYN